MAEKFTISIAKYRLVYALICAALILFVFERTRWLGAVDVNRLAHQVAQGAFSGQSITHVDLPADSANQEQTLRWAIFNALTENAYTTAATHLHNYMGVATVAQKERMRYWMVHYAQRLAQQGNERSALAVIEAARPWLNTATYNLALGDIYNFLGNLKRAAVAYEQSLTVLPTPAALLNMAKVYATLASQTIKMDYHLAQDYYKSAAKQLNHAITLDPSIQSEADLLLGDIYWKMDRRQESVDAYLRVTENLGNRVRESLAWYYLGNIYALWWADAIDYSLARSYFERAYTTAPDAQLRSAVSAALTNVDAALLSETE